MTRPLVHSDIQEPSMCSFSSRGSKLYATSLLYRASLFHNIHSSRLPNMIRIIKYLTLALIAKPWSVIANQQVPVIAGLGTQQTLIKSNAPLPVQGFSPANPISQDERANATEPLYPWLITSPYTGQEHLTDLSTLPLPSRLLTLALTHLEPTNSSYATTTYDQALNWPTVFEHLKSISDSHNHTWTSTIFYVVEFRSRLKIGIDRDLLFKLDRESHREATASGGLLKYWFGKTSDDAEGRNLATCKS